MSEIRITRDYFLFCLSCIYLFGFASLYYQIPGLYGDKGILPIRLLLKREGKSLEQCFAERPTLLWLAPHIGIDPQSMMEIFGIVGIVSSMFSIVSHRYRNSISFGFMWALYFSLYQVGQTFLWFQWDILLLETGFLAILVAPLNLFNRRSYRFYHHDAITFWLVRWLLFRFMFSSGVVKLTSQCPTWWGLTALQYHFESQCIPTPLSWFAHHMPKWLLKLGVVGTFFIEIPVPFLFFSPIRSLRMFAFLMQVLFQMSIVLTGNYNFFNFLTIALCLSLLDDNYFGVYYEYQFKEPSRKFIIFRFLGEMATKLIEWVVYLGLLYWTTALFSLKVLPNFTVESNIAFTMKQFTRSLEKGVSASIWIGVISLGCVILRAFYRSLVMEHGLKKKLRSLFCCVFFGAIAFAMFGISVIPHTVVNKEAHERVWPIIRRWHDSSERFHVVNAYGLFRRMTGVGGRPEVILEGSHSPNDGYQEYEFHYKPGRVEMSPPLVIPHQPRLDWQMWFAALGKYNHNPWFMNFVYRLLHNQREVVKLLAHNPFVGTPPKYVRATLFTFHYSAWELKKRNKNHPRNWWKRKKLGVYLPVVSKDNATLVQFLKNAGLWETKPTKPHVKNWYVKYILRYIRKCVWTVSGTSFLWSLLFAALTIKAFAGDELMPKLSRINTAIEPLIVRDQIDIE